jgi:hypothetical protein
MYGECRVSHRVQAPRNQVAQTIVRPPALCEVPTLQRVGNFSQLPPLH